jgi:hypothetical protein
VDSPGHGDQFQPLDHPPGPWIDSPRFIEELEVRSPRFNEMEQSVARDLNQQGFTILRGVIPEDLCNQVRTEVEPLFEGDYARREHRVADGWREGAAAVRDIAIFSPIQELLAVMYERKPIPFQTLNFKWGSQQGYHSDSIHFTSIPDRYMCGVWVALEDVDEQNGPLTYYPGSHRVPQLRAFEPGIEPSRYNQFEATQQEIMLRLGVQPVELTAKKGDALVWTSNLLHGGRPILREGSTRWSQVTHYFFEDCIYFQPIYSNYLTGEIKLMDIVDLNTLEPVEHRYGSLKVITTELPNGRKRFGLVDDAGREVVGDVTRIHQLESQLAAVTAERDALRGSTSFRLGHAVVGPLDRIRNRIGR